MDHNGDEPDEDLDNEVVDQPPSESLAPQATDTPNQSPVVSSNQTHTLQEKADLATDFSNGFYPLQFNDGLATATDLATDLPTDKILSPK